MADTEVGFGRGGFSFPTTSHELIGDLVTVLWLSRPERRGWRGVSIGTDRQTEGRADKRTGMASPRLRPTFPD